MSGGMVTLSWIGGSFSILNPASGSSIILSEEDLADGDVAANIGEGIDANDANDDAVSSVSFLIGSITSLLKKKYL